MSDTTHERARELCSEELTGLRRGAPKTKAGGAPAVINALDQVYSQSGLVRGTKAMMKLNQLDGFDCPSCAWPDPEGHRAMTEFCENGAKAIAAETTKKRVDAAFLASRSVRELAEQSDYWLEQQGRLCEPMLLEEGASHYRAVSWNDAFDLIARELNALPSPDDAIFYTSGRASNEAAFLYQLFVRQFGTNNLPDCSNMCHESSGAALGSTIGIGKGTVTLEDIHTSEAIFLLGQNPGTNHPRMLSALQQCVRNGGRVVAVNPLKEAGMLGFAHPQEPLGLLGKGTALADMYIQLPINADHAFLRGMAKVLLEDGSRIDHAFIEKHTQGFEAYRDAVANTPWPEIETLAGVDRAAITAAAHVLRDTRSAIFCWAMGLTQHKNAVVTIQEIVSIQLMLGNLGKPGAGLCPVRGHSNVQGDRTMGIFERMPEGFLAALDKEFGFTGPREHGYDTVDAIRAMHGQPGKVFIALGGNFLMATPDTVYTAQALRNCSLTVQVSTKLNRSHLVTGRRALILPCLGRSERDMQRSGEQLVSMENSMSIVHASRGRLTPASGHLQSETSIVSHMAEAVLGARSGTDWKAMREDYDVIRNHIERVVPGFGNYNERVRKEGGFYLPNNAKELDFSHLGGARFTASTIERRHVGSGQFLLMTIRSHDQFNTTIYDLNDRYRGIRGERRVVFMHPDDMRELGLAAEQPVDITSHWDGQTRRAPMFLAVPYDIPRGNVAAYFPETNVLVPVDSIADMSQTPTSKAIAVSIQPCK